MAQIKSQIKRIKTNEKLTEWLTNYPNKLIWKVD